MIANIGYILNLIIWIICVFLIKSIKYAPYCDREATTFEHDKEVWTLKDGKEYQTIKLSILEWILSILVLSCPYFGGLMIAINCYITLMDYTDISASKYVIKKTEFYYKTIKNLNKIKYFFEKIFGWLFIKI